MDPMQQSRTIATSADMGAIRLLLAQGELSVTVASPEQVIDEIEARATQVSSILEGILLEPHGHPRWGLNE